MMLKNAQTYFSKHKWLGSILALFIALFIVVGIETFIFFLAGFMPHPLALGITYLLGLLGMLRLLEYPTKSNLKTWLNIAIMWAGVVLVLYDYGLSQRGVSLDDRANWGITGFILFLLPIAISFISSFGKRKQT